MAIGREAMRHNASLSNARGFSLIELSIALLVLGLIAVPLMQMYKVYRYQKDRDETYANNSIVQMALGDYYMKNGVYPKPADRTLGVNSANYGRAYTGAIPAAGNCIAGNGICVGAGSAVQADTVTPIPNPNTIIGGVPFAELGIPPEDTLDGWNRKLVYAVTQNMTEPPNPTPPPAGGVFNRKAGTINMNTFNVPNYLAGVASYVPADSADPAIPASTPRFYTNYHIVVFSLGADGAGAYDQNGNLFSPCVAGRADSENCDDNDGTFFDPMLADLGSNQTAGGGSAGGAFHYDDILLGIPDVPTGIWSYSNTNAKDITTLRKVAIATTDHGIQINEATGAAIPGSPRNDTIVLDVGGDPAILGPGAGNMTATKVGTNEICDVNGGNCFAPEVLGGDSGSNHITCGAKDANGNAPPMSGIARAAGICDQLKLPATPNTCALNHEVIGFNAGNIICN